MKLKEITNFMNKLCFLLIIIFASCLDKTNGHGRLIEPPSRSSAWRYGFQTPPNYNDHELFCGGFTRQQRNGGKCGECGDPWDVAQPRPNEYGGKWGQGVVVRQYNKGTEITIRIELTASHMGYFEFRVCPDVAAKQDCLDKHLLEILGGAPSVPHDNDLNTRFYPRNGSRIYEIKGKLPNDLECPNCVLQWKYIAGNNWGTCEDGTGAVGCGPQEQFRACADITIGDIGPTPAMRPVRPSIKPTTPKTKGVTQPIDETTVTTDELPPIDDRYGSPYVGPILITICSLLAILCILAAIYLYHYHGSRIKHILRWKREQRNSNNLTNNIINNSNNTSTSNIIGKSDNSSIEINQQLSAPVPPPRTKRLSQNLQEIDPNESSILNGSNISISSK